MMPQNLDLNLRHLSIYSLVQKEFLQNSFITENSYKCLEDPQRVNNVKSEILTEIIFLLGAAHLISSCFDFLCYNFILTLKLVKTLLNDIKRCCFKLVNQVDLLEI